MFISAQRLFIALALGCSVIGCSNIGSSPAGGSAEEVKAAFDKMPLEERVKLTKASSMPNDAKQKKIAEMYQKEGKTPPDEGASGAANAPGSGLPPGMGMPSQGGR